MKKIVLLAITAIFVFTGCGHKEPEILIQKEIETVYVMPPKEAYEKIIIPTPIAKEKYMSLNIRDREKELGIYITRLISEIKAENLKKEEVVKYLEDIEKKNKEIKNKK